MALPPLGPSVGLEERFQHSEVQQGLVLPDRLGHLPAATAALHPSVPSENLEAVSSQAMELPSQAQAGQPAVQTMCQP